MDFDKASGQGTLVVIPPEVKKWNWAAFFLTWIWGMPNKVYISLLMFAPFINIVMPFVLGAKGNEWAWQNRKWDSVEHFRRTQREWAKAALIVYALPILVILFYFGYVSLLLHLPHQTDSSWPSVQLSLPQQPSGVSQGVLSSLPYQPIRSLRALNTVGWHTYISPAIFGFSIVYPPDFTFAQTLEVTFSRADRNSSAILRISAVSATGYELKDILDSEIQKYHAIANTRGGLVNTAEIKFLGYKSTEIYARDNQTFSADEIVFQTEKMIYTITRSYDNGFLGNQRTRFHYAQRSKNALADNEALDAMVSTMKLLP